MSDSDFDHLDDTFAVDDSFLRQLDDIEVKATASISTRNPSIAAASAQSRAPAFAQNVQAGPSRIRNANPGAARRAAALGVRLPRPAPHPSSDDYGDMSFTAESLEQIDEVTRPKGTTAIPSSGLSRQRSFARSTSGNMLQTHLNFRRENPYTKGKRWDRTVFAATGRRRVAANNKQKGARSRYDDEEDEQEDSEEPLAPDPLPLVDTSKPYEQQKHHYVQSTIGTYLYPTNHPKRSYQYDIIRSCFTDNTLVALPTGLGKTFVAGVVMLNFYRWFPTGKIVFLAPTRPLVDQQIEACQLTCGIPSQDAAVMTGQSMPAKKRDGMWDERRVFYCTPQTLDNDLRRGAVDPRDIILAVFDEAHKASGSFAYTTILALITAQNPFFRVLALTATPGNDVPKVQGVVDALHISRIEIREAESPEVRQYMNEKRTEKHVIQMGPVITELRDRWAALMKPIIQKLVERNILTERDLDAKRLRTFRVTSRRMEIARDPTSGLKWAIGTLRNLEKMCRAMAYLLEFSLGMFHTTAMEIAGEPTSAGKAGNSRGGAMSLRNNIEFQRLIQDAEGEMNDIRRHRGGKTLADSHPKMEKTLELLLAHFAQAEEDEKEHAIPNSTRAMVFCSFRECVLELVDMLNEHPHLLRATRFVGQSQGKQAKDQRFTQKEQKKTIQEFKDGKFNILVATSIGEEGLDIGEVDFVVLYDMPKQSIKLLQRVGRTGRKRDGRVHVLMSEGREDQNWETAQQTHRDIQEEILHSRNLELFEDVERLLPPKFPVCIEKEMEIDPWDPSEQGRMLPAASQPPSGKSKGVSKKAAPAKKKRVSEVPPGYEGFKSVALLLKEGASKRVKRGRADSESGPEESLEESALMDEDENWLLHPESGCAQSGHKTKNSTARTRGPKKLKSSEPNSSSEPKKLSHAEEQAMEVETFERKREDLNRRALDFFNTQGPIPLGTSSPTRATPPSSPHAYSTVPGNAKLSPRAAEIAGFSQIELSLSSDEELELVKQTASPYPTRSAPHLSNMAPPPVPSSSSRPSVIHETPLFHQTGQTPSTGGTDPTPFPVRRGTRRIVVPSSEQDSPAPRPLQRLRRRPPSSPSVDPDTSPIVEHRARRLQAGANVAQYMDLGASVSGSESSDESSGEEDESDRLFAGDFEPTQAPLGYDQRAMYRAGLSTQVVSRTGLGFTSRDRHPAFLAKARKPVLLSDDEQDRSSRSSSVDLNLVLDADYQGSPSTSTRQRASAACLQCRRLKSKCRRSGDGPCDRCSMLSIECEVVKSRRGRVLGSRNKRTGLEKSVAHVQAALDRIRKSALSPTEQVASEDEELRSPKRRRMSNDDVEPASPPYDADLVVDSARASPDPGEHPLRVLSDIGSSLRALSDIGSSLPTRSVGHGVPGWTGTQLAAASARRRTYFRHRPGAAKRDVAAVLDPVSRGIVEEDLATQLVRRFFDNNAPQIGFMDRQIHTLANLRARSALLTTAVLAAAALSTERQVAPKLYAHAERVLMTVLARNAKSPEIVLALMVLLLWSMCPARIVDDRSRTLLALAINMALELGLNRLSPSEGDEETQRFHRDKIRTWCALFIQDRSLAATSGKPFMLHEFPDAAAMRKWMEHPFATHGDRMVVGYLELRRIERDARDQLRSVPRTYLANGVREGTSVMIEQWLDEWLTPELAAAEPMNMMRVLRHHINLLIITASNAPPEVVIRHARATLTYVVEAFGLRMQHVIRTVCGMLSWAAVLLLRLDRAASTELVKAVALAMAPTGDGPDSYAQFYGSFLLGLCLEASNTHESPLATDLLSLTSFGPGPIAQPSSAPIYAPDLGFNTALFDDMPFELPLDMPQNDVAPSLDWLLNDNTEAGDTALWGFGSDWAGNAGWNVDLTQFRA
ncbi:hypothetical protein CspeluHIS016_0302970 [Cutaneotrichosporon spelunceum]|uniref:DNA helicase n=1 Tax=Cutaneotrichosporon spelunceum TaxID=1672016 RepID=A0AAD3TTX1_9TREE|nr:hypothetical protein CspeluHIS016_0302970 [Cutaneotrichosporon spelunceum]